MASKASLTFLIICSLSVISVSFAEKEENLVFYMHDIVMGSDVTVRIVGGVNGTNSNLLGFGTVMVIDDLLTKEADPSSQVIGRAKGIYENVDVNGGSIHMVFSVVFEDGSTLEIAGTDPFSKGAPAEVAVIGGTRRFRFARGYAILEIVSANGLNGVIKFSATLRLDEVSLSQYSSSVVEKIRPDEL